jgi:Uma2 family endonuclease
MATALVTPPITVEQYLGFEGYPGLRDELINGRIVLSPQPKPHHQHVVQNLYRLLWVAFENSRFFVAMNSNIRFDQANSMPAPDVFVVSKKAWFEAIEREDYLQEAPLLVVEVLSPANRKKHVEEKTRLYLERGVQHVLIADPKQATLRIGRIEGDRVVYDSLDTFAISDPVPVSIAAGEAFQYS